MIDILYTPSQTILVIIYGSFQYLHNMKKQVKTEEKFVTAEILNLESRISSQIVFNKYSDLLKAYIINIIMQLYNLHAKFIQNVYTHAVCKMDSFFDIF